MRLILTRLEKKFETDTLATSLIPDDIETLSPQSFVGVKTSGNGNCLYNAASLFLCGNESLNSCLRLLTASELFLNAKNYIFNQRKVLDLMKRADNSIDEMTFVDMFFSEDTVAEFHKNHNLTQSIRTEAMKTATDRSWSGILQLMALAEALKTYCSVVSVRDGVIEKRICN